MPLDTFNRMPRPVWGEETGKPGFSTQSGVIPPKPPALDNPVPMPKPRPGFPVKPPYIDNPIPMPKPVPGQGNGVPVKPPHLVTPTPMPKPIPGGPGGPPPVATPGQGSPLSGYIPGNGTGSAGTVNNPLAPNQSFSPYSVVTDNMNNLLSSDSRYIQNARRRGLEQANSRGMLNSSIAAGASERSAIEAAQPILNNIMGLTSQRESQANQSLEAQRNRQFQSEFALLDANIQDWINNQDFNRQFNGQLAMLPIASAADMWSGLMQLAASDPTVFTPDVLAGYQDFFQSGFNEYISRYLQPGGT